MPTRRDEIRAEVERIYFEARVSAQVHFEYAKSWRSADRWLGSLASLLAGLAGASGLSEVATPVQAGFIALAAAAIGALATSLGARGVRDSSTRSAYAYLALEQDARVFILIELPGISDEDGQLQMRSLLNRLQELKQASEIPSSRAWKKGTKEIAERPAAIPTTTTTGSALGGEPADGLRTLGS